MATARILIIESEIEVSNQLASALQEQGFDTTQSHDVNEGIVISLSEHFDLIVADASLPTNDDLSVLQSIRVCRQTPVIVISALNTTEKRIESFQQGADDYISKPYDFNELVLRINAILRRTMNCENEVKGEIDVDQLTLLKSKQRVLYKGDDIALTPIQFRLLWVLVDNRFKVVSKQFLYQTVLNRNFSPYDRSLEMHLSRIRKKLVGVGMSADRFATVHGKGYRFS